MYAAIALNFRPLVLTGKFLEATINTARRFKPKAVYQTLREDIRMLREAKSIRDSELCSNPELLKSKLDVKLTAAIAFSEFVGTYIGALSLGLVVQYVTGNAYKGVGGTIIGDYFPAVFSFQAAWLALNTKYYKESSPSFLGRAKNFFKDVLPIHKAAVIAALPAYAVGAGLSALLIATTNIIHPDLAHKLPIPIISEILNGGVVELIYLALLFNLSADYIEKTLAPRYSAYLERHYGTHI